MVNIVVNRYLLFYELFLQQGLVSIQFLFYRARRDAQGSDDSSLDSDATLELHLSDGGDDDDNIYGGDDDDEAF